MSDHQEIGLITIICCILAIGIFSVLSNTKKIDDAINECKKNLPRTQHCHLIGVPDEIR